MTKSTSISAAAFLSLAACASSFVLPESAASQRPLRGSHPSVDITAPGGGNFRWPGLPSTGSFDESRFGLEDAPADHVHAAIDSLVNEVQTARGRVHDEFAKVFGFGDGLADISTDHHSPHHPGDTANFTIYQLISSSQHTTKFAKIVDKHPSIVDLLNSTDANYTLFVPTDEAFAEIPDDHPDPPKEYVEDVLRYHIGLDKYSAGKILSTYTIPSALNEKFLGGEPQRLRTSFGLGGVKINFYSKVVAADIAASNGVIHGVNHILIPPPFIGGILNLFPNRFSTLLLAYEKTDFVKFLHSVKSDGNTVFAPTNGAFAWLGPKANAFLFNTEQGKKYLSALLKYQIVPDVTLYTDAIYDERKGEDSSSNMGYQSEHYDLPTLLGDARIGVDIARIFGFATMKVNGFTQVIVANGIGKNGVIQVVDQVPLPPYKHKSAAEEMFGDVDVEELKERLEPYLE
ncbi:Aurofusarin biosynthesis cluster S-like protein [Cladobotryum mycophilum]|uniref:Aurofusarin biosynthesis cluster S-like protein n=1 Tax=Cladobotryum mycophilum TaxID=491253 RepID=A0ABR0SMV0_9HYPO